MAEMKIQELEPERLESGPEDSVTTTDIPIREEVKRTVAAILARELAKRSHAA